MLVKKRCWAYQRRERMQNISAVVLTKNEENNIKSCLESLKWCDETIVVDDNSTDDTVKIAKELSAKVFLHPLNDFSSQRNFGISKASKEWILFADADERVSDALAFEISNVISNWTSGIAPAYRGFYIPRIDVVWGKELRHGESGIRLLRLAKRNVGKWEGMVHEEWKVNGKIGTLRNPIAHHPHPTVVEFLKEINFYTTLRAKELYSKKVKTNVLSIISYPLGKFILNYFLNRGFLDGISGLVHALLMSLHSFLVRGKLWTMWNKK
jgi:glycosyltransferase involved in cell wall biosynthesis